ncbi:hypothetical protein [Corallibacter sp.]|uniref:hypothetical protein n=1 Tax=Corallibacter sp. TaxID=2038084 RepID=UPI003AB4F96E
MKTNKLTLVVIIFVWVLFIVWELLITEWSLIKNKNTFRVDILIIFPLLQFITIYTLIKVFSKIKITK